MDIDEPLQQSQESQDDQMKCQETGVSTQTDHTMADLPLKLNHNEFSSKKMHALELRVEKSPFGLLDEESNDDKWKYHTEFEHEIEMIIFFLIETFVCATSTRVLRSFN
ncbi:hypothetical protein JTB14_005007 [Gonioctena quinquepunctata]|nr:hypothetical protein JTB14_005007 [Gonioctena quinquepunctata]